MPEFHIEEKVLVRNHRRYVLNPMYGVAYCIICVMGCQLELVDEGGKVCKVNFQDVKITWPVNELIRYLPDMNTF